jgi:RimJ/RimL family protein N-acetyltransferase
MEVAVQRLNARHRDEILRHLLQLPEDDRRLRFGHAVRDDGIRQYVEHIDFERDRVFGILDAELELLGVAHLALDPRKQAAEFGVSVNPACRGKGYGFTLLERVVLHAANLGYRTLFMVCLSENRVMMHLAQKAGLRVVVQTGEVDAQLRLDRRVHGSPLREAVADQVALVDTLLKQQVFWLSHPYGETERKSA